MSIVTKARRLIGRCSDPNELSQIADAVRKRQQTIAKRRREICAAEAWQRVKNLRHGDILYCGAAGVFFGNTVQRGDRLEVHCVQPRAKRLWVKTAEGKLVWFAPLGVSRWNLTAEEPASKISGVERQFAAQAAAVLNGRL